MEKKSRTNKNSSYASTGTAESERSKLKSGSHDSIDDDEYSSPLKDHDKVIAGPVVQGNGDDDDNDDDDDDDDDIAHL
jgi:hypothetical protein